MALKKEVSACGIQFGKRIVRLDAPTGFCADHQSHVARQIRKLTVPWGGCSYLFRANCEVRLCIHEAAMEMTVIVSVAT